MISFWESFRWSFCSSAIGLGQQVTTSRFALRSVKVEGFAQVNSSNLCIGRESLRRPLPKNLTLFDDVGSIRDLQRFADVMVGDKDSDAARAELRDDALNLKYGNWIDSCKGFI